MPVANSTHSIPIEDLSTKLQFLWLEITEKCNLQCVHCYAESSPHGRLEGDMKLSDWFRVLDEAYELGCRSIQFIGGEPTLHPHFKNLISYAGMRRFDSIEVFTNGTRMTSELLSCAKEYSVQLATSFYSPNPDVHDAITFSNGSWKRTVNGIKRAIDSNISLRVGIIATDSNADGVNQTIAFLKGMGVKSIGIDHQRKIGRGADITLKQQSLSESYAELCGQCWKQRLCVTAAGDVFPCVFSRATLLGRAQDGLKAAYESGTLRAFGQCLRAVKFEHQTSIGSCWPELPCTPQNPCTPELPCGPQVQCNPDAGCQPQYRLVV